VNLTTVAIIVGAIILVGFLLHTANRAHIRKLRESGLYPPSGQGTPADVKRLIMEGQKIAAIKLYRQVHGVGLKESREAVERIARDFPSGYVKQ
jgi:ribosomal protein L7/L12